MTFQIDTGAASGSQGPWLSWSSNGSMPKQIKDKSWVLRDKNEEGHKSEVNVPAFETGCVLDLDSLKLGWEKDGGKGMAPERRWNPSISQSTPRPDESKKNTGGFTWSRALSIRCAIGGGRAATWEQGSFAAYEAFDKLSKQIMAQWPTHSENGRLLPLVKQTAVDRRDLPSGAANIPVLSIEKWVPRPDCLKADAPVIATGQIATPAPAPQPAAQPASSIPADAEF